MSWSPLQLLLEQSTPKQCPTIRKEPRTSTRRADSSSLRHLQFLSLFIGVTILPRKVLCPPSFYKDADGWGFFCFLPFFSIIHAKVLWYKYLYIKTKTGWTIETFWRDKEIQGTWLHYKLLHMCTHKGFLYSLIINIYIFSDLQE